MILKRTPTKSSNPKHEVFIDDQGILRVVLHGRLRKDGLIAIQEEQKKLMKQMPMPIDILADARDATGHDADVRYIGLEMADTVEFHKVAVLLSPEDRFSMRIFEIVITRSKKAKKFKVFINEAEAVDWLLKK